MRTHTHTHTHKHTQTHTQTHTHTHTHPLAPVSFWKRIQLPKLLTAGSILAAAYFMWMEAEHRNLPSLVSTKSFFNLKSAWFRLGSESGLGSGSGLGLGLGLGSGLRLGLGLGFATLFVHLFTLSHAHHVL